MLPDTGHVYLDQHRLVDEISRLPLAECDHGAAGDALMIVTVGASGAVTSVKPHHRDFSKGFDAACLVRHIETVRVKPFDGAAVESEVLVTRRLTLGDTGVFSLTFGPRLYAILIDDAVWVLIPGGYFIP